ncbi:MAG TPA: hypothetical protein VIT45_01775 [Allosphingosinicella sp.]
MADGGNPFNARMVFWLIGAGIVAFAAFMLLLAYAPDFGPRSSGRPTAMSGSAIGFRGVHQLIEKTGSGSYLIRDETDLETADLVVFTLEQMTDPEAIRGLANRRAGKATMLVLPKWQTMPDPKKAGWVRAIGRVSPVNGTEQLKPLGKAGVRLSSAPSRKVKGQGELDGLEFTLPASPQTVAGEAITPLIPGPGGGAVLGRLGNASLYILADPDLINNMGMKDRASAQAAVDMLSILSPSDEGMVAFDLTANGLGKSPSALKLAFEPPFLALTLAVFIAALLAGLHGAFRFGPAAREKRAIAFGKAALVENSAGLFRIAKREHRTGPAYAELIREEAAHATAAGNLHREALDSALDRFTSPDKPSFTELAARASSASHRYDLVGAAHALFQWKKDLIK